MDRPTPHRIGVYLGIVQLLFTLTWTVYVIFLPKLAAQAGIPKQWVVYILLLDQIVFAVMDFAMGMAADRVSRVLGKLGHMILGVTIASCAAFLLLPFAAPQGAAWLFLALTILWAITSSALRAPPLVLIGRYTAAASVPWRTTLSLLGLGLASTVSPYLTTALRDLDPRIPFIASSAALALATLGIIWAERTIARESPAPSAAATAAALSKPVQPVVWFFVAVLLLGLGYQIHFSLNSAALYLRLAKPDQLPYLMPVFWIGFNVCMLPASAAVKRYGGIAVASAGAIVGAIASFATLGTGDLNTLIALQFVAGGGWGCVLMSVTSAAIAIGHTGREGRLTGGLCSLLALAGFMRIALLAAELNKDPEYAELFAWLPVFAWSAGGLILLGLAFTYRKVLEPAIAT